MQIAASRMASSLGMLAAPALCLEVGCTGVGSASSMPKPELVIGQRGQSDGRFQKPRAIAIDSRDQIYVIDFTGRIQKFDPSGKFVRGWRTPQIETGKPSGIFIDNDGTVIVADTHYFRYLFYTPEGELQEERTIGGTNGPDPGEFAFVTDIVRAQSGDFYCSEYGEFDRIQKYSSDGRYIDRMGEHGDGPLQFSRPQSLNIDEEGFLWVADAHNHRIQVIDWRSDKPRLVAMLGQQGTALGQFQYPYGMILSTDSVVLCEYGNHRVQRISRTGKPISSWGAAGSELGQLSFPWAVAADSQNRVYVVDSGNNRVQRFRI